MSTLFMRGRFQNLPDRLYVAPLSVGGATPEMALIFSRKPSIMAP
jgi:hypothetical protein